MKKFYLVIGLFTLTILPICAQNIEHDSVRLLPPPVEELKGTPQLYDRKEWLDFDLSLPNVPMVTPPKMNLTLQPYTPWTPYDWDPIRKQKIKITKDTWKEDTWNEDSFKHLYAPYTNMKGTPPPLSLPNAGASPGAGAVFTGDLMYLFTKDFWNFHGRKNRARTDEVFKSWQVATPFDPSQKSKDTKVIQTFSGSEKQIINEKVNRLREQVQGGWK
ncbi:MAG: DUF4858 domain-containing protein [Mediterranea sp.]|jgi:hypothetical protein|nr:DUF4858 domain-containing protein [Mediterranea sp.]